MRDSHLTQIQNDTIVEGARAQKERLRMLFPELMPSPVSHLLGLNTDMNNPQKIGELVNFSLARCLNRG